MNDKNTKLKNIPQVEKVLHEENIRCFIPEIGHNGVVKIIRTELESFRSRLLNNENPELSEIESNIIQNCESKKLAKLQRVINGTGVIIHTNLGRSPMTEDLFEKLSENISGYCNLEYDIAQEKRGKRGGFAEELICELTSAEDALIVNNNASSVFLILKQFAENKEAIVSRGELIQIGGGFRIPDIMKESGVKLVEVGTTNITELKDFKDAINENTAMVFSAHQSNYKIEGFTDSPELKDLGTLKNDSVLFVRDLGSGNLIPDPNVSVSFEPTVSWELSQGPDLVCFSGDKLLGGCQAGIIVGKKDLISKLRKNPLMRMLRVDKITYYILQETLIKYINNKHDDLALWKLINQTTTDISKKITKLLSSIKKPEIKSCLTKIDKEATFGGGSMPSTEIKSKGLQIHIPEVKPEEIYSFFLKQNPPIAGTIIDDYFTLDFMTILDRDIKDIEKTITNLYNKYCGK